MAQKKSRPNNRAVTQLCTTVALCPFAKKARHFTASQTRPDCLTDSSSGLAAAPAAADRAAHAWPVAVAQEPGIESRATFLHDRSMDGRATVSTTKSTRQSIMAYLDGEQTLDWILRVIDSGGDREALPRVSETRPSKPPPESPSRHLRLMYSQRTPWEISPWEYAASTHGWQSMSHTP